MATDNEPLKLLLPYLQLADELEKHEPLVAYYCRWYAVNRGDEILRTDHTETTKNLVFSLVVRRDHAKKSLKLTPDESSYVESFIINFFLQVDKKDRAGEADMNTAKTFYPASILFEVASMIGEYTIIKKIQKYAAWKAADIRKALNEGRKPIPGPPDGDTNKFTLISTLTGDYPWFPSETYLPEYESELQNRSSKNYPSHTYPKFLNYLSFTNSVEPSAPPYCSSYYNNLSPSNTPDYALTDDGTVMQYPLHKTQKYEYDSNYQPPPGKIAEAQNAVRFAGEALASDDVFVAVDHLKNALELLTGPTSDD